MAAAVFAGLDSLFFALDPKVKAAKSGGLTF